MKRLLALLVLTIGFAGSAHAACGSPSGQAGQMIYAGNYNMMVYCNGSNWVSMAGGVSVTVGGTTNNPGGNTNDIQYNGGSSTFSGSDNFQWLNASNAVSVTGIVSATNFYGLTVSGSTGTFGSIGVGNINASGQITATTLTVGTVSSSGGGTVSATYGYFTYISASSGLGSGTSSGDRRVSENSAQLGCTLSNK